MLRKLSVRLPDDSSNPQAIVLGGGCDDQPSYSRIRMQKQSEPSTQQAMQQELEREKEKTTHEEGEANNEPSLPHLGAPLLSWITCAPSPPFARSHAALDYKMGSNRPFHQSSRSSTSSTTLH
ncbi:hypothetical protein QAD02_010258 [Eretmocerus hayati]|uniref:Uncharacterized protein n=1 Tax=Eretmocerus hayati TaxID=131215 RepID=A0ACC2NG70_9HYME|nr:hypothetical protein QAD02_010258 [Eretmocerus hayati]